MNENCKYCKTSKTCLENADYNSIYCQLHKRIPKIIGKTYDELQEENKQLKENQEELIINNKRLSRVAENRYDKIVKLEEVIHNAKNYITHKSDKGYNFGWVLQNEEIDKLLDILDIDKEE